MIIEKELKKLFHQLVESDLAHIDIMGSSITVRIFDQAHKISLTTPVYNGGNYIPNSVRECIASPAPFDRGNVPTSLTIDEENFQIILHYIGIANIVNNQNFIDLVEEFCWLAEEWRYYLDEHDKKDRVHIPVS